MEEWRSLLRIPSVSCQPEHSADMMRCAQRWQQLLLEAGCQKAEILPSQGNPFVFAEYKIEDQKSQISNAPTVLVYAHYDVMPVEPVEAWHSDPWEATIRDGRLYARGADDDKGQTMIQAKAFEYMVKTEQLNCNVKFIFEGEEEIGSPSLEAFLEDHKDLLKADIILVSDTSMIGKDTPSITTGLRGLAYWQIEVDGPNRDLHSGHFGGAVKNPVNALCEMIAKIVDADGRITIPGFYDDVLPIPEAERAMIAQIPFSQEAYNKAIDVDDVFGEVGYSTLERNSCVLRSMYAVYGAGIRAKDRRPFFLLKPLRRSPVAWWRIRTMRLSRVRSCVISNCSHPRVCAYTSRLCMGDKVMSVRSIFRPIKRQRKVSR